MDDPGVGSPGVRPTTAPTGHDVGYLILKASIAALTSGLGGLPLYFLKEAPTKQTMSHCVAFASGLMFGCAVVLSMESYEMAGMAELLGSFLAGFLMVYGTSEYFSEQQGLSFGELKGANASRAIVIFLSMCLHSIGEGFSIGVSAAKSFGGESSIGPIVLFSLALHNVPEGMAIAMVFCAQGMTVSSASFYAILCNLPQPLLAIPSFVFMNYFEKWLPSGLGFAAGSMLYVVVFELLPEAKSISVLNRVTLFAGATGMIISLSFCCADIH